MPSLNDFIDPDLTTNDVMHSNGYGTAAGGGGAGGLSMEQRRKLLYGRKVVGSYNQSQLGQRYGAVKARTADQSKERTYDASTGKFGGKAGYSIRKSTGTRGGVAPVEGPVAPRRTFIEPPTRTHDPYA